MIRSINRFFSKNSRWLFGIFTVIIIVAFMDFLSPGTFGGCAMSSNNEVGTVFGEKVTYSDLRSVMTDMEIIMTEEDFREEAVSTVDFIWMMLISSIPVVGIIYIIYLHLIEVFLYILHQALENQMKCYYQ
mgnify:CR=1 FL=1